MGQPRCASGRAPFRHMGLFVTQGLATHRVADHLPAGQSLRLSRGGPGTRPAEEYGEQMTSSEKQTVQDEILGHRLEVTISDDDLWGVAVDGREVATRFGGAYDAWAAGVAESYRQGRVATASASDD